jgi:hypothetical protein
MWMSFFIVALAIALGFGFGAVILEANTKNSRRRYARRRVARAQR